MIKKNTHIVNAAIAAIVMSAAMALPLATQAQAALPATTLNDNAAWTIDQIRQASAIVEGASGNDVKSTVYIFMDPNCIYCHLAWKALQPYESHGLQVHWLPIAFLKPDSTGKAAALLQASNGPALLKENEMHYDEKSESGGIAPLATIPAATQAKLKTNLDLFDHSKFNATPTVIYQDANGQWKNLIGFPRLSQLAALLRLPEQPETDPELQRYR